MRHIHHEDCSSCVCDLSKARETLLESIREIERETQAQFNATFARVSEAFTQMYARLFAGGEAKMWQTQPENLSETGIEIEVRPPGKKAMPLAALSGGERRRVEIARALSINPKFILLDEPFSGIDPIAVLDLQKIISNMKASGIGVLITDHNVRETLTVTDRAYIINDGKIFRHGTPEQLGNDSEVRRVYLGESFSLV